MRPVSHGEHETRLIGAPAGWNEEKDGECGALSVFDWQNPETKHNHMISSWELEEGDLEKIRAGARIHLSVMGEVHPVVCVYVGDPPPSEQPADAAAGTNPEPEETRGD